MCMPDACRSKDRMSDPRELELETAVHPHGGTGNWTQILLENKYFQSLIHHSSPILSCVVLVQSCVRGQHTWSFSDADLVKNDKLLFVKCLFIIQKKKKTEPSMVTHSSSQYSREWRWRQHSCALKASQAFTVRCHLKNPNKNKQDLKFWLLLWIIMLQIWRFYLLKYNCSISIRLTAFGEVEERRGREDRNVALRRKRFWKVCPQTLFLLG